MDDRGQEPRRLFTGGEEPQDADYPRSFSGARWFIGMLGGGLGLGLGVLGGLYGGATLDEAMGFPMGRSNSFLSMGHLTVLCTAVGPPLGALLGAFAGHKAFGGHGRFWAGLLGVLVGVALVVGVSLPGRGLVFPALLLLPVMAALGLELGAPRE
jgi:hypothetical protein